MTLQSPPNPNSPPCERRFSLFRLCSTAGTTLPADLWPKSLRSYFVWDYGKVPDVVIEVVSNREGGEVAIQDLDVSRRRVGRA